MKVHSVSGVTPLFGAHSLQASKSAEEINGKASIHHQNPTSSGKVVSIRFGSSGYPANTLKLMTYNVDGAGSPEACKWFGYGKSNNFKLEKLAEIIKDKSPHDLPDVIALQEVIIKKALKNYGGSEPLIPRKYDQTGFDAWLTQEDGPEWIENWVKKHLGDAYGVICSEGTNDPSGKALAILYKKDMIPVAKKSHYGLKNQFSDNIFTRDLQEVHFQIRSQRDPSKVENLVVLNSHFYANLKHNRYGEQRQKREYLQTADIIQEILKADPNTHIAAMGDFNLPTDHRQRKDLLNILTDDGNAMVDSFMKHHMAVPTCRSKMEGSTFRSDCILLTPTLDANVQDLGVIGNFDTEDKYQKSSPHLPVFVATNTSIPRNEWLQFKRVTPAAATTNKATPIGKKLVVNG